ncbi:MAG: hypothetical protein ACQES9_03580 [Myxococcota bacterium]
MINHLVVSRFNAFFPKISVLQIIILPNLLCIFFLFGCQKQADNKQPEKPELEEVKINETENISEELDEENKKASKIKLVKVLYSLRWNGKFLNGKADYQIKSEENLKKINFLHDPGIRIHSIKQGVISERKPGMTLVTGVKSGKKRLKIEFGLKVHKEGRAGKNIQSEKNGYVLVTAKLLPLPSTTEFINSESLQGEYKYKLNYDSEKWRLYFPGTEKVKTKSKIKWDRSGPSLEIILFKGKPAKMELEKFEILALDGYNQNSALKKIKNYLEIREKCRQSLNKFPLKDEFILFRKTKKTEYSGFSLYILPPSPTCADILKANLIKNLPVFLNTEGIGFQHLLAALLCHNLGKIDYEKGKLCLNKFKQQYLKLNYGSQKLPSSRQAQDAQKTLTVSGLLQWNCQKNFCPGIQEKLFKSNYLNHPSKLLELLNLNKKFPVNIFRRNLFIKAKVHSVIKKKDGVEIKIKNQGDFSWAVPLVYKSTKNKVFKVIQLPAPGKIKSYFLPVEGRPLNADLDPDDISLMLPFGWTRKGPPLEAETEEMETDQK